MFLYKAAVIGLGQIGLNYDFDPKRERPSSHVSAYQLCPHIELAAAADVRKDQAARLRQIAPGARFYQSISELLQNHSVDIISICTPAEQHLPGIQYILENSAAKIIFCEKPLVRSLEEAIVLTQQLQAADCLLVPNLSRRWNSGMQRLKAHISEGKYGTMQKIHVRYTRGIFNTGAHVFDLLHWWGGQIDRVQVIKRVTTSADKDSDPSFTFHFQIGKNVTGFADAFNDEQYYLFEIDLYFAEGKIEVRNSGDDVFYYQVGEHPLFTGFKSLHVQEHESKLLAEATLGNAIEQLVRVLDGAEQPACTVDDGIYPLYVAETLLKSYNNNGSIEKVVFSEDMQQ
jgi:predicted dehydrogenase